MPIEDRWINNGNRSYSVRLVMSGTKVGTNGKGITAEFALASAFGEFMERLQNQVLYPLFVYHQYDTSLQREGGFVHAPDEVYMGVSEILENPDASVLENILPVDLDEHERPEEYLRALSSLPIQPRNGTLLCIPFYSLTTDSLVYLPRGALSYVYGTNGMCAGNTPEEALVQGICEIIERYSNKMTILKNMTPPEIPKERFSHLGLLTSLDTSKYIDLMIKDGSLGENLPAVSVAVINREHNKYFVKFASHVELDIALERTLTELLQGRTIERLEKGETMTPFEYLPDDVYTSDENLFGVFGTGEGRYNNDFFGDSCSYPLDEQFLEPKKFTDNKAYLRYLIQMLLKKGWHILVRDVSFLGVPAFHVIIPGISELSTVHKKDCRKTERIVTVARLLKDVNQCTREELLAIAHLIEDQKKKDEHGNIAVLTCLPYLKGFPWGNINFNLFLSTLYLGVGDFGKSHVYMKAYIDEIEEKNIILQPGGLNYYKCVRDYLALLAEHKEPGEKISILQQIYGDEVVSEVVESIFPERALTYYQKLLCPDCSRCPFRQACFYPWIRIIHAKIKRSMAAQPIDQLSRNRAFWREYV
jgi:ribosomal protein S12 methylthiotransferase accessory factor